MSDVKRYDEHFLSDSISNSSTIGNNAGSISEDIQHFLNTVDSRILTHYDQGLTSSLKNYSNSFDNDSDNMREFGQWLNDTYDDYVETVTKVNKIVADLNPDGLNGNLGNAQSNVNDIDHEKKSEEEEETKGTTNSTEEQQQEKANEEKNRAGIAGAAGDRNRNGYGSGSGGERVGESSAAGLKNQAASIIQGSSSNKATYASLIGLGVANVLEGVGAIIGDAKDQKELEAAKQLENQPETAENEETVHREEIEEVVEENENKNDKVLLGMGIGLAAAAATGKFVLSDDEEEDPDEEAAVQKYMNTEEKQ